MNEDDQTSESSRKRLGRLPLKTSRKALLFSDFFKFLKLPATQKYWLTRKAFPLRSFGNLEAGDCTRASQANAILRMERLEQRRTVSITDAEVLRVYRDMSDRLYGGGDNGAFEDDALNEWRNPETTIRDSDGRPYTIDAYLRINALNHVELKAALAFSGAKGIKVCFNLPAVYARREPPAMWDIPAGQAPIGEWLAGSWGGHSGLAIGYDAVGLYLDHTWEVPINQITWEAAAVYLDEAHLFIDSLDAWRKRTEERKIRTALGNVRDAVNAVSAIRIAA